MHCSFIHQMKSQWRRSRERVKRALETAKLPLSGVDPLIDLPKSGSLVGLL